MRPRVIDLRRKASAIANGKTRLQRIVIRERSGLELIHVEERAARGREWSIVERALGRNARVQRLIDVAVAKQLLARRADIPDFRHDVSEQLALNVEIVVLNVRRTQVWVDCEHIRI